jgi:CBS domain-containing protein
MTVARLCQRDVDVAGLNESVTVAAERMHQRSVGALVVVDDELAPVGILTDRDLVIRVLAPGQNGQTTAVGDVMTRNPQTIAEDASIESALALMRRGTFRRLPVVDRRGALQGIVTLDDILQLLGEELFAVSKLVESETPRAAAVAGPRAR